MSFDPTIPQANADLYAVPIRDSSTTVIVPLIILKKTPLLG
ncbi:MAG: hypothetical protein WCT04_23255 [Planctomycetota bacterium]